MSQLASASIPAHQHCAEKHSFTLRHIVLVKESNTANPLFWHGKTQTWTAKEVERKAEEVDGEIEARQNKGFKQRRTEPAKYLIEGVTRVYNYCSPTFELTTKRRGELLEDVEPLWPYVGGRQEANRIINNFNKHIRERLHTAGKDIIGQLPLHTSNKDRVILLMGNTYANSIDVMGAGLEHALRFTEMYIRCRQQHGSNVKEIDASIKTWREAYPLEPREVPLFPNFESGTRQSVAALKRYESNLVIGNKKGLGHWNMSPLPLSLVDMPTLPPAARESHVKVNNQERRVLTGRVEKNGKKDGNNRRKMERGKDERNENVDE